MPVRAGADLRGDGLHHLQQQPRPVRDRAAVGIAAVVDAVAQELLQQVAVGAVHLHPVEAGGDGVARGRAVVGDDARQLVGAQRAASETSSKPLAVKVLPLARRAVLDTGWLPARLQRDMRDAPHVPQLHDIVRRRACTASVMRRQPATCSSL
jgi:hypothetical protein